MGVIFLAHDTRLGHMAALKALPDYVLALEPSYFADAPALLGSSAGLT